MTNMFDNIVAPPCPWGPPPGWTGTAEEEWDLTKSSMVAWIESENKKDSDYFADLKAGKAVQTSGSAFEGSTKEVVDLDTITTYDIPSGIFNHPKPKRVELPVTLTRWQRLKRSFKGVSND